MMTAQDFQKIQQVAEEQFILDKYSIHGVEHWKKVEKNAIYISKITGADMDVVRCFALLHDYKREDDYADPEHGERAADFIESELSRNLLKMPANNIDLLISAVHDHNKGTVSEDKTIGACFDADRIELIRVGIIPDPDLMSTEFGKNMAEKFMHIRNQINY